VCLVVDDSSLRLVPDAFRNVVKQFVPQFDPCSEGGGTAPNPTTRNQDPAANPIRLATSIGKTGPRSQDVAIDFLDRQNAFPKPAIRRLPRNALSTRPLRQIHTTQHTH
jgi:hypothetical protein